MCHIVKLVCLTVLLLVTVQSLRDDHYFYEMSPLTELGRYLNQSETDFETKMKPVCSCQSLPFRTNYTDEYCYCTLGCPIPEHPFTQELLLPSESVKCFRNVTTPLEMKGRVRSKPLFPYFCHRPEQIMDGSARWFAFLCIHDFSLNHVRHFFDINPGWSSKLEKEEKRHEKYGWRNDNKEQNQPPESERESRRGNGRNVNALDLLTSLDAKEEVKIPSGIQVLGNINFTMEQENEAFHLIRVLTPINFTISVPTRCSRQAGDGRAFRECTKLIRLLGGNCTLLKDGVLIAARIFAFTLTNATSPLRDVRNVDIGKGGNETTTTTTSDLNDTSSSSSCESIPVDGTITEVRYRDGSIGVYVRFDRYLEAGSNVDNDFPVKFSFNRADISNQDFANLPRFWNNFLYAKCPSQYCWRDLGKFGLLDDPSAWRMTNLDDLIVKHFATWIVLPLVPVITYFLVQATLL